jgi:hypothetical protein
VLVAVFIVQMLGKRKMLVPKMIVVLGIVAFAAPFLAYMIYGYVRFNLSPLQMLDAADITNRCGAYVITIGNEASRYLNCWIPQIFNSGELNAGPILGLPIIFIGLGFALKQRFANRKRFS